MQETIKTTGSLHIVLTDENGNIKEEKIVPNLVVNTGRAYITGRMLGTPATVMSHMEVGTSSTIASAGQTALVSPVASSRTALTSTTQQTTTTTNDSIRFICTFPAGVGTGSLTEAGIFDSASAGNMLCRSVFSTISKTGSDTLTITWTITLT